MATNKRLGVRSGILLMKCSEQVAQRDRAQLWEIRGGRVRAVPGTVLPPDSAPGPDVALLGISPCLITGCTDPDTEPWPQRLPLT